VRIATIKCYNNAQVRSRLTSCLIFFFTLRRKGVVTSRSAYQFNKLRGVGSILPQYFWFLQPFAEASILKFKPSNTEIYVLLPYRMEVLASWKKSTILDRIWYEKPSKLRKKRFWTIPSVCLCLDAAVVASSHGRKGSPIKLKLKGHVRLAYASYQFLRRFVNKFTT